MCGDMCVSTPAPMSVCSPTSAPIEYYVCAADAADDGTTNYKAWYSKLQGMQGEKLTEGPTGILPVATVLALLLADLALALPLSQAGVRDAVRFVAGHGLGM